MPYPKVNWQNGEAGGTPLNATNLNIMDNGIKANEDAITQNTADIEELKNKPTTALILTSASPLPNTTASNILGIDVSGKSEQETTKNVDCVQGGLTSSSVGYSINQAVKSNTTRCVTDVFAMINGGTITVSSGYQFYTLHAETADGLIDEVTGWRTSLTLSKDGYYRFLIKNDGGTDLTPSQFTLKASGITPTPASPIPIVDASGEIVAKTRNLFDAHYGYHNTSNGFASGQANTVGCADHLLDCNVGENYVVTVGEFASQTTAWVGFYNADGSMISRNNSAQSFTIPNGCAKFFVSVYANGITASNYPQIMLEQGTIATEYVEYQSNSITLPYTLRSVGTVADTLVINKDGSGKLTQGVTSKLLNGTENWSLQSINSSGIANFTITLTDSTTEFGNATPSLCSHFIQQTSGISATTTEGYMLNGQRAFFIRINSTTANTVESFKSWLSSNNVTLYYALATPIVTELTAEQVSAILALRTYNKTTIIDSEMDVNSVTYSGDVKGYVEDASAAMALNSMKVTRNIPSMEAGEMIYTIATPTGFPYSENYKCKAYIVQAGAFIPFKLNSVTCTSTYISVSVTFPDGVGGAGTLELLLYWDEYKPIDVAPIAMVMSIDEGGAAE